MNHEIRNEKIAAFMEEDVDAATAREVLAAAISDSAVRDRIGLLRAAEALVDPNTPIPAARRDRVRARMLLAARAVAEASAQDYQTAPVPRGGGLWQVAAEAWEALSSMLAEVSRPLTIGSHVLRLPCLASAAAAPSPSLVMRREAYTTADGVHIEFQQLPGEASRLRLLVDASALDAAAFPTSYNAAFVTLEEHNPDSPSRHILVVSLNSDGRGYTDFTLAYGTGAETADPYTLPAPRGACRLAGATLARLPVPPGAAAIPAN